MKKQALAIHSSRILAAVGRNPRARVGEVPVIFHPTSPALVPELGRGDADSADLLASVRALIDAVCATHPVASISLLGNVDPRNFTAHTGSFRAWGAPAVEVGAGNHLAELVGRYIVGDRDIEVKARRELGDSADLVLYGIDGPAALSDRAPLTLLPGAPQRHQWCQELLAGGDVEWPMDQEELVADGIVEADMWWALRGLRPTGARVVHASAAHGVGRYVALWEGWTTK